MFYEHAGQFFWWLSGVGISWSFQTLNLEVFKTEQKKLFVLISIIIILCADSVATYASVDQILCLKICERSEIFK